MTKQHARIDLETALDMYDRRALTAKGLVEIYFRRSIIPGTIFTKTNEEIYTLLRISERTYYRALAELRGEEILFYRTTGKCQFALESETLYEQGKKGKRRSTNTVGRIPDKLDSQPDRLVSQPDKPDSQPDKPDSQPDRLVSETPPKPLQGEGSGASSSLLQLSYNSSSSINQANPDDEEEDGSKNFSLPGKPVKAGKHKLAIRALAEVLEGCSDDRQDWEKFLDWCDDCLWNTFEEPVRNKIAWLKSIDPETGMTRLEVNWVNYESEPDKNAPRKRSAPQEWQKVLGMAARLGYRQRTDQVIDPQADPQLFNAVMAVGGLGKIGQIESHVELSKVKAGFIDCFNAC